MDFKGSAREMGGAFGVNEELLADQKKTLPGLEEKWLSYPRHPGI